MKLHKAFLAICLVAGVALEAYAEPRYYTEFKNELNFEDFSYQNQSYRNSLRLGMINGPIYFEAGPSQNSDEVGASYEFGYKKNLSDQIELKGKIEGYRFGNEDVKSKVETELRYYFN